jgi:PAS domain S-box-containing protein
MGGYTLFGVSFDESSRAYVVGLAILAALLPAVIVFLFLTTRQRAGHIAEKITEDLLSSRELFVKLYQNSPVPYVLLSGEGTIAFPNSAALRLFGLDLENLSGTSFFSYLDAEEEESKQHIEILPSWFRQGVPIADDEVQVKRPDGQVRWVLLSVFPLEKKGGEHNGLATLVDITKQKEIDRAKTEFVSLASHQLRTPLSSLKWNVELLTSPKSGALSERQQEQVATLTRGIDRLDTIISDFLNVSRLELGTLRPEKELVSIPSFIADIISDLSSSMKFPSERIVSNVGVDSMVTSQKLLRMALENLISNAMKYTPAPGTITVSAEERNEHVTFVVSDSGLGIPKEEQGRIFSKLFRASNVREEMPDGTGLGLYICRMIVEILGGTITFTSSAGTGTTFTITLPRS